MKLSEELKTVIGHDVYAYNFALSYLLFCHAVDDIIDEPKASAEHIIKTWDLATIVFTNPFYIKHYTTLSPLIRASCNFYADSVEFEKHNDWRKNCADILRHSGNMVIVATVELVAGYDAKRFISKIMHEDSHDKHKGDFSYAD